MNSLEKPANKAEEIKEKIIVTGGTEGIGKAITMELAKQNHDIVICARTQKKLDEMKTESGVETIQLDLNDTDKIENFIKQSAEKIGGTTILILNAAVSGIRESTDYTFNVNYNAQKKLVESAADLLRVSNGRIIFLTSPQSENPIKDNLAYGQSKKATKDWLKEFSQKEENQNIHIFSINPGPVNTKMHDEAINYGGDIIKDRSIQMKNEGKLRDPQIIGRIISKMSVSGKNFNPETKKYNTPILNNEIITISDENIEFEKSMNTK